MSMKTISVDQVDETMEDLAQRAIFVFSEKWCPDCVSAAPIIDSISQEFANVPVYLVPVGSMMEWKSTNHELRAHPFFKLSKIPTLMVIDANKSYARLEEAQCLEEEAVRDAFRTANV
ncbi:hypothetical protein P9112_013523 [Eukaryota sp. TZLM1-RC]